MGVQYHCMASAGCFLQCSSNRSLNTAINFLHDYCLKTAVTTTATQGALAVAAWEHTFTTVHPCALSNALCAPANRPTSKAWHLHTQALLLADVDSGASWGHSSLAE